MGVQKMEKVLRKPEVIALTSLSDSTILRMEKSGRFPRRIRLGTGNGSVGWILAEVTAWLEARGAERPAAAATAE